MSLYSVYKSGNSILKYGFNHRYHYSVIAAKKIIQEGKMGNLLWMRGIYGKAGSIDFKSNWRNYKNISGGGILIDQGIHMVDLFRYLSGQDFIVKASIVKNLFWDIEAEDNVFALLISNNIIASLHSTATQWKHKFSLEMTFENGYLNLDGILSATRSYSPERLVVGYKNTENIELAMGKPIESISTYEIDNSWHLEIKEFLNAIINNDKISNGTIEDAIKNLDLIEKIYDASNE
jgi:predicted dehydrogenase